MLLEEIKNIKSDEAESKKFGITIGIVSILVAFVLFYFGKESYQIFSIIGGLLIIGGIVFPNLLKPIQKLWMTLAVILGFVMSRVILLILFYFVVTPIGLLAKISGKDFLDLKLKKDQKSYWLTRETKEYLKIDTERQF
ncbi:MAG: hypothetical protein CVV23_00760 [Ignavibacteriae bacterium HGW-Ignavibacteriae-2]|jgi:hypothetical protein|nr:MAG: hypothetical protein CVV23_00760 [Ignavibacteriae bacterium HGW-Ignavibacteriae-2]